MLLGGFFEKLEGIRLYAFAASCLSTVLMQFATFLLPQFHSKVVFDFVVVGVWIAFICFSVYYQYYISAILFAVITFIIEFGYCVLAFLFTYYLLGSNLDPRCTICLDHKFAVCNDVCDPNRLMAVVSTVLFFVFAIVNGICVGLICKYVRYLIFNSIRRRKMPSPPVSFTNTVSTCVESNKLFRGDVEANRSLLVESEKEASETLKTTFN